MSRIGFFDSGVGGLTVLRSFETLFPECDLIYFADSLHFPYGQKSSEELLRFAIEITSFLLQEKIQLLIIACHTASAHTLAYLQANFSIPILGMIEPTLSCIQKAPKKKKIALLATEATIRSNIYQKAVLNTFPTSSLFSFICPQLIEQVEKGELSTEKTFALIQTCLEPIHAHNVDILLLASTHYSLLERQIAQELSPSITLINPAFEVASYAKMIPLPIDCHAPSPHTFFVSGDVEAFTSFLSKYPLQRSYTVQESKLSLGIH